eukprot:3617444-Pyramimonas_sp.AAC.2
MTELERRLREYTPRLRQHDSQVDPHTLVQVEQCYQAPWFVREGSDQVSLPQRFFFPGQPLADVLFELQMAECMTEIRERLKDEGLPVEFPATNGRRVASLLDRQQQPDTVTSIVDVSYADDSTIVVILPALHAYPALSLAWGVVTDAFAKRGRKLMVGTAKTTAMIMGIGHGMKRARRAAWHEHGGRIQCTSGMLGELSAPIVHHYVHLGLVIDANGSLILETKYRATSTVASLQVWRRRVFKSNAVHPQARMTFADSPVLSGRM